MRRIVRLGPWSLVAPRLPTTGPLYLTAPRTFPAPWSVVEIPSGFRVEDANHRPLVYTYGHDDAHADVLMLDEARRKPENFAGLSGAVQS
jgi:hypothetical protein